MNKALKKINLYFGLLLFIGFLVTGYYMAEYFKPEHQENHVMRMQIRANHIYILFISLLNVLAFKCELTMHSKLSKYLDISFRIMILTAGIISVIAFLEEHTGNLNIRAWTLFTVILSVVLIGVMLTNEFVSLLIKKKNLK